MKILLLNPSQSTVYGSKVKPSYAPLGMLYIASVLEKEGHQIDFWDFDNDELDEKKLKSILLKFKPDLIGFTATTSTIQHAKKIAKYSKNLTNAKIIFGGIHTTIAPNDVLKEDYIDLIIIGEGEISIKNLVKELEKKKPNFSGIRGIGYKVGGKIKLNPPQPLVENLDDIPFPARHLIKNPYIPPDALKNPVTTIMTSRGCPGRCTYCCTKNIFGFRLRFRSVESIITEIESALKNGSKEIHIMDDNFTVHKQRVLEFRDEILKRKIKTTFVFSNGIRADKIDEDILKALKDIGVLSVGFGVESGNQRILDNIKKDIKLDTVRKAYKLAKKFGFETWGFFIVGLPGENKETVNDTIEFAKELDPDFAKFLILKPYPGSEVFKQLDKDKLIFNFDYDNYGVYTKPVHNLPELSAQEMIDLQKKAFRRFYLRPKKIFQHLRRMKSFTQLKLNIFSAMFVFKKMFS